jgi:hypothetical protein
MTAISELPISQNIQSSLNFKFTLKRAPALSYYAQSVTIPDVHMNAVKQPNPSLSIPQVGDHLIFDPLIVTFKVDSELQNWLEIFNWMKAITNPYNTGVQYSNLQSNPQYAGYGIKSNLTLLQLDSQKNPTMQYEFENAMPVGLTGPKFDATSGQDSWVTSTASFVYLQYHITTP